MHIESRKHLAILTESLNLAAKPQSWLCNEIKEHLEKVRHFRRSDWSHVDHWDCGRQDAFGDRVDELFRRWTCLKLARRIQRGDARMMNDVYKQVIGEL